MEISATTSTVDLQDELEPLDDVITSYTVQVLGLVGLLIWFCIRGTLHNCCLTCRMGTTALRAEAVQLFTSDCTNPNPALQSQLRKQCHKELCSPLTCTPAPNHLSHVTCSPAPNHPSYVHLYLSSLTCTPAPNHPSHVNLHLIIPHVFTCT